MNDLLSTMSNNDLLERIYCQYALAMNYAQHIEQNLITLLVMREKAGAELPQEDFLALERLWERSTLGRLIREIDSKMGHSSRVSDLLEEARNTRNYLAHQFFSDRAEQLVNSEMHQGILSDLQQATELLETTTHELLAIIKEAIVGSGMTEAQYEEQVHQIMAGFVSRPPDADDGGSTP